MFTADIIFRAVERLVIDFGAIFIAYLGYRLFNKANDPNAQAVASRMEFHSPIAKLVLSGKAPGLFFMACGSFVLVISLLHGGSEEDVTTTTTVAGPQVPAVSGPSLPSASPQSVVTDQVASSPEGEHPATPYSVAASEQIASANNSRDTQVTTTVLHKHFMHKKMTTRALRNEH